MIPIARVMERLNRCYEVNDSAEAKRLLQYWYGEAKASGDDRGRLSLVNEMMGLFRKMGDGERAIACADEAQQLIGKEDHGASVSAAVILVNCGTVYTAFGRAKEALVIFRRAESMLTESSEKADAERGSLYNNMAAGLAAAGEYEASEEYYGKALAVMRTIPGSEPELAVTKLNLANLLEAAHGMAEACERIEECVSEAHDLLETAGFPRDGHLAFVCEKCAPVFEYYGWFSYAAQLRQRAKEIYGE